MLAVRSVASAARCSARPCQAQDDELASPTLRISWADFQKLYDAGGLVLIDVRDGDSFEAGHIPGARSIPLDGRREEGRGAAAG